MTALDVAQLNAVMGLLDRARSISGSPITEDSRRRIFLALEEPTQETWCGAYSVLINEPMTTLWQAVLKHTDYDVTVGPLFAEWKAVPTRRQLFDALTAELEEK